MIIYIFILYIDCLSVCSISLYWSGANFFHCKYNLAREERFPVKEDSVKEFEQSLFEEEFKEDLTFGGFWYVNFANLERKNMDLLDELASDKKRSKSF